MTAPDEVVEVVAAVLLDERGGWFVAPGTEKMCLEAQFHPPFDLHPGAHDELCCAAEHPVVHFRCSLAANHDDRFHVASDGTYVLARWAA